MNTPIYSDMKRDMKQYDDDTNEIKEMKNNLRSLYSGENERLIDESIEYASNFTAGQKRENGDPTIIHPLSVAIKTAEIGLGPKAICAALLHDTLEDSDRIDETGYELKQKFGDDIFNLVSNLSIIRNNPAEISKTKAIDEAQQYLIASIPDLRVIMIKLADKIHNLETIDGLPEERQAQYIEEIKRLYLPIAKYLGMGQLYQEVDKLIFKNTNPKEYNRIKKFIQSKNLGNVLPANEIIGELQTLCKFENIPATVEGRIKSIPSIHKKTLKYEKEGLPSSLEYLRDILAFRIITDSRKSCYQIVSAVRQLYDNVPKTYRDYITKPKPNGYRSLHITPIHPKLGKFELQIVTEEMHEFNEFGPASHLSYKKSGLRNVKATDEFSWTKQLHEAVAYYQKFEDKPISTHVFNDYIFVLTPKNDFIRLPKGATPIDLAYKIHTDLGNSCIGVSVNNRPISLDTCLKTGDIVEIKTNSKKKYANNEWLDSVVTERARERIEKSNRKRNRAKG